MPNESSSAGTQMIARVFKNKAELANAFYRRLFEAVPETRALFSDRLGHQKEMFSSILGVVVKNMQDESRLDAVAASLALKHRRFNITDPQFEASCHALIAALRDVLGPDLSDADERAWLSALTRITRQMRRAQQGEM